MTPEIERVRAHIARAEAIAHRAGSGGRSRLQRIVRGLLLGELAAYRAAGRFPRNRDFLDPTPYFIDADGTRCAMAHLMELGGAATLVARVAATANHARVVELAAAPTFAAWLSAAGLTEEEAAAIQPSYCEERYIECICGGEGRLARDVVPHAVGVLEVDVLPTLSETDAESTARIVAVYGRTTGYSVGQEIRIQRHYIQQYSDYDEGSRALVAIGDADGGMDPRSYPPVGVTDGRVKGCKHPFIQEHRLQTSTVAQAWLSGSRAACEKKITDVDEDWAASLCDDTKGGCAVPGTGATPAATVAILVAVVGALGARALRRRKPTTIITTLEGTRAKK